MTIVLAKPSFSVGKQPLFFRSMPTPRAASPYRALLSTTAYVSVFAQLGCAGRLLIGELFAGSCGDRRPGNELSWIPCVAASGVDQSFGGALFRDLPANIFGCFIMGLLSSTATLRLLYPTLSSDERPLAAVPSDAASLQQNSDLQVGLRTGFCGSMTTFASWKLQMLQMLLAGKGVHHRPQWLGVGMGLIVGTLMAMGSLVVGQHLALALHTWRKEQLKTQSKATDTHSTRHRISIVIVILLLTALSASALYGILSEKGTGFWRRLSASVLAAPFGAVARWQLSVLNSSSWFPAGTFMANILACLVGFCSQGIDTRWSELHSNYQVLLFALRSGFAGCLSTVSTWTVEIQKLLSELDTWKRGYLYLFASQLVALCVGIIVYGCFIWI